MEDDDNREQDDDDDSDDDNLDERGIRTATLNPIRFRIAKLEKDLIGKFLFDYIASKSRTRRLKEINDPKLLDDLVVDDDVINYVTRCIQNHFDESPRSITLSSTMKNRINDYIGNRNKDKNLSRSRVKKHVETDENRRIREEKEKAHARADAKDAELIEKDKELKVERKALIAESNALVEIAEELLSRDIIFDAHCNDYKNNYDQFESNRIKLTAHINWDVDCAASYNKDLRVSDKIYELGYREKWDWAIEIRQKRKVIQDRDAAVQFVTTNPTEKKTAVQVFNSDNSTFEEKMEAIKTMKKNEKGYISDRTKKIFEYGKKLLLNINNYFAHKNNQYDIHELQTEKANNNASNKRKFEVEINDNTVLNQSTINKINAEHKKINEAIKEIKNATYKIKELDSKTRRYKPVFFALFSDPDMPNESPNPIFIQNERIETTERYRLNMIDVFNSFFACDLSDNSTCHKLVKHKQNNDI
jgi:hypothetical protein